MSFQARRSFVASSFYLICQKYASFVENMIISLMLVLLSFNSLFLKSTKKVFESGSFANPEVQQINKIRSIANFFIEANIAFKFPTKQKKVETKKSPNILIFGDF
jgi:hypothetical protein